MNDFHQLKIRDLTNDISIGPSCESVDTYRLYSNYSIRNAKKEMYLISHKIFGNKKP